MKEKDQMQFCFNCGEELGYFASNEPLQTCGKLPCEREARDQEALLRQDAHEELDRNMGW